MAFFPIIGLAYLAAVESLLAAGASEEGDVGDTAVGAAARGHGGHAGESSRTMAWLQSQLTLAKNAPPSGLCSEVAGS